MTLDKLRKLKNEIKALRAEFDSNWLGGSLGEDWGIRFLGAQREYQEACTEYVDYLLEETPKKPHGTEVIVK